MFIGYALTLGVIEQSAKTLKKKRKKLKL